MMGDSLSKIYDDYEEYKLLCKELDIKPLDITDTEWLDYLYKDNTKSK